MDVLKEINNQILKEKACIEDLIKEIVMHTNDDRYQLAAERGQDMQNSIVRIQQLERQKGLYLVATKYTSKGINIEVVKRYAKV